MGNLVKFVPSLGDKVPTMNSLLPILSELASSKNETMISPTTVSTLPQTTLDELILPPILFPRLQVATLTPSTTAINEPTRPILFFMGSVKLHVKGWVKVLLTTILK